MKARAVDPAPRSVRDVELALQHPDIRRAVDDYVEFLAGERDEPRLWTFSEHEIETIHTQARRLHREPFDERQFVRKMRETRPRAVQPEVTDEALDMWYMLAQPEILESLWPSLDPRTGARGRRPGYFAKALLFTAPTVGASAHFNANYTQLRRSAPLRTVFEWVERMAAAASGMKPRPLMRTSYEQAMRQLHLLAERVSTSTCIATNVNIVRAVHALLNVQATDLAIDAMLWPAWVPQIGERSPEREAQICKVARNAKPRTIGGKKRRGKGEEKRRGVPSDGSSELPASREDREKRSRFARGYFLIVLVDLATGLPLVWALWRADADEVKALKHLLHVLYEQWPNLRARTIVADAAWDEEWAAEWTLVNYGVHLVANRHPSWRKVKYELRDFDSELISRFLGDGRAICRKHGIRLIRDGYEGPSREGLLPGEPTDRHRFRIRHRCPADPACGRPGLAMRRHWTALAYYPHSVEAGRADLHAHRLALLARRNACEALFSALQVGHKLGLGGAARTRTAKEPTVEALLSIAMVMRSAFLLAAQRVAHGEFPAEPPPDLAAALRD